MFIIYSIIALILFCIVVTTKTMLLLVLSGPIAVFLARFSNKYISYFSAATMGANAGFATYILYSLSRTIIGGVIYTCPSRWMPGLILIPLISTVLALISNFFLNSKMFD